MMMMIAVMICTYFILCTALYRIHFLEIQNKNTFSFHRILVLVEWSVQVHKRVGVQIVVEMHIKKGFLHFTWFIFLLWNIIMEP